MASSICGSRAGQHDHAQRAGAVARVERQRGRIDVGAAHGVQRQRLVDTHADQHQLPAAGADGGVIGFAQAGFARQGMPKVRNELAIAASRRPSTSGLDCSVMARPSAVDSINKRVPGSRAMVCSNSRRCVAGRTDATPARLRRRHPTGRAVVATTMDKRSVMKMHVPQRAEHALKCDGQSVRFAQRCRGRRRIAHRPGRNHRPCHRP